jgi:hypothetical protein
MRTLLFLAMILSLSLTTRIANVYSTDPHLDIATLQATRAFLEAERAKFRIIILEAEAAGRAKKQREADLKKRGIVPPMGEPRPPDPSRNGRTQLR